MIWGAVAVLAQLLAADLPPRPPPDGPFQAIKPGLYETIAPDSGLPAGPLVARPTGILTEWLEVTVSGEDHVAIVFQPDGRVSWAMKVGPQGPIAKTTLVDGVEFVTSTFTYGPRGACPLEKRVTGPGLPEPLVSHYRCDAQGRILARGDDELIERNAVGYVVRHRETGATVWSEQRFLDGRVDHAWIGARDDGALGVAIARDPAGRPRGLVRTMGGKRLEVPSGNPVDPRVGPAELGQVAGAGMSRALVHAFLGAPRMTHDDGNGLGRRVDDVWSDGCWLNRTSGLNYDPTLRVTGGQTGCICGLCVSEEVPVGGAQILGLDTHVRNGPWVALDGIVVTADHPVLTPTGAVLAGWLGVGSVVMGTDGPRTIVTFERLPDGPRRGRNLRTQSGVFDAGGILFLSDDALGCPSGAPFGFVR